MANEIPFKATGYPLPEDQGQVLTNGVLEAAGTLSLAGDAKSTNKRKTNFPIWKGQPAAGPVGEGERKPVTGAEVEATSLNVKKFASIMLFTQEQIEDILDGDLDVLVDSGVRKALAQSIDAHLLGIEGGANVTSPVFDSFLRDSSATAVEFDKSKGDGLQKAISQGMSALEANGYIDPEGFGVVLGSGFNGIIREAREASDGSTTPLYTEGRDPLYGLDNTLSTNLNPASAASGKIVGFVVNKANIHTRLRTDVIVKPSTEAVIEVKPQIVEEGEVTQEAEVINLYQDNVTALLYELRLGVVVHDLDRAIIPIKAK